MNDRGIWTIPNLLSVLRLLGVPVFLWLIVGVHEYTIAFVLLVLAGITDYADGAIARRWNQFSEVGAKLDPLADRLYIAATVIGLAIVEIIGWWLVLALLAREVFLLALVPALRRTGRSVLPVSYIGKTATFALLWGFPLLLLSTNSGPVGFIGYTLGWAFSLWGLGLYWYAAVTYAITTRRLTVH